MLGSIAGRSGAGRWRRPAAAAVTALVVLIVAAGAQASSREDAAHLDMARSGGIAGQYIVVLKGALPSKPTERSEKEAKTEDARVASSVNARPRFEYDAALKGFAADLTSVQLVELRHSPAVAYVDQDERVTETTTQGGPAPWNLDRIDQPFLPLNQTYDYSSTGAGVTVYVIDSGIQVDNRDFESRARFGVNTVDRDDRDCNGHGTHVAGTVGGTKYGVAKLATLVGVKVFNCAASGTAAGVIAGVNWVTAHHVAKSVANMSLGGAKSDALNEAVTKLTDSGVFVAVAAGNNNQSACNYSPASTPAAFTVAASDSQDRKARFSNHGPCVDAYAPGVDITSDWIGSPTATHTINGTSMASPVVAGIAALYLSTHTSTPAATSTWIVDHATTGVINGNAANTVNRLVDKADL